METPQSQPKNSGPELLKNYYFLFLLPPPPPPQKKSNTFSRLRNEQSGYKAGVALWPYFFNVAS